MKRSIRCVNSKCFILNFPGLKPATHALFNHGIALARINKLKSITRQQCTTSILVWWWQSRSCVSNGPLPDQPLLYDAQSESPICFSAGSKNCWRFLLQTEPSSVLTWYYLGSKLSKTFAFTFHCPPIRNFTLCSCFKLERVQVPSQRNSSRMSCFDSDYLPRRATAT